MKNVKTNRIISSIIIAMMVVTSLIIPVSANPTETLPSYQSSVGFNLTGNGVWGEDNVWSATLVDLSATNPYSTVKTADEISYKSEHGTYVSALDIAPVTQNDNKDKYATYGGAKTFTAPYSGKIKISYADVANGTHVGAVVKYAWNQGMKFRVTKQVGEAAATTIYPTDAVYVENKKDNGTIIVVPSGTTTEININRGDKLHFEVMRMENLNPWQGVYCDPIVTYTEVYPGPETRDFFKASEKFDLTSGGSWDDGVWQALFYEWEEATYKQMSLTKDGNLISHNDVIKKKTDGTEYNFYSWGDRAVHQAATYMREEVHEASTSTEWHATAAEKSGAIARDYPAKAFNAPKTGVVTIDAAVLAPVTEGQTNNIRIQKMATDGTVKQIWPESGTYSFTTAVDFEPIIVEVLKGEKLLFESVYVYVAEPYEQPGTAMNWDPTVTYVPAPETRTTFTSSEYFNFTSSNFGEWDGGVWKAMHYDFDSTATSERDKYLPMVTKKNETGGMTFLSWPADAEHNWGDKGVWVAKYRMRNELAADAANANEKAGKVGRDYPVKVFTAPKAGIVNIGAALLAHITQGQSAHIRIMKMPADGGELVRIMPYDKFYSFTTAVTEFPRTIVEVKKGDKLLFEAPYIYNAETSKDAWQSTIDWDPTVTYLTEDVAAATTFKSSEYFTHINADGTWANGVWQAMFYDYEAEEATEWAKYKAPVATKDFTNDGRGITYLSQPVDADHNWGDRAVTIGKTFMRADVLAALVPEEWNHIMRDYPVKVFTAPKTGVVSIGADLLKPNADGNFFAVRIMKLSAGETTPVEIFPGDSFYRADAAVNFAPVDAYLEKGDKLLFEAPYRPTTKNPDVSNGMSAYSSSMHWDPTVTYTDGTAVDRADIVFKNGENTVTSFADIAAAASLTAEVPVFSGTAYDNAIVFVGIYDADGMLVRIAVSDSKPVVAGEETPFSVTFTDAASSLTAGSVKVFLWDSLTGLNALTDAGSIAVMVQEAVQE